MNKEEFFKTLDNAAEKLGIKKDEIVISHGGASLYYGLRDSTNDIDVQVYFTRQTERILKDNCISANIVELPALNENCRPVLIYPIMGVDFHIRETNDTHCLQDLARTTEGYWVTTRFRLLKDRIDLAREKDLSDAEYLFSIQGESLDLDYKTRFYQMVNKYK
jgi:hypothetical protein